MIKFSAVRLDKEPIELIGSEPATFLDLPESELFTVSAPVNYRLVVKKVSGGALVEGDVSTEISGQCGRCLEPVSQTVSNDEICLFLELDDRDEVEITEEIRAEMLVALPMTLECREECAGLCPVCGVNRNEAPCSCKLSTGGGGCWSALDKLEL